jgi:hypothetical protein
MEQLKNLVYPDLLEKLKIKNKNWKNILEKVTPKDYILMGMLDELDRLAFWLDEETLQSLFSKALIKNKSKEIFKKLNAISLENYKNGDAIFSNNNKPVIIKSYDLETHINKHGFSMLKKCELWRVKKALQITDNEWTEIHSNIKDNSYKTHHGWVSSYSGEYVFRNKYLIKGIRHHGDPWTAYDGYITIEDNA